MSRRMLILVIAFGFSSLLSCGMSKDKLTDAATTGDIAEVGSSEVRAPEPVCVPGEKACQDGQTCTCNSHGTAWTCSDCYGNKQKCFEGDCCQTDCEFRECGDDGCGGSCGDCGPDEICDDEGRCRPDCWEEGCSPCELYPGQLMCPCEKDDECNGYCMPGRQGSYCAPGYDAGGCGGYDHLEYMEVWLGGGDIIYLCVERALNLCLPCEQDSECLLPWAKPGHDYGDKCVSYGDAGSFCGIDCYALWPYEGDCPSGYQCVDGQCVSESGTCNCPPYHVELGTTTTCMSSNEHGACPGTRICTDLGLSDCDAPVPAPEQCDGVDNNCDGETDEGCDCVADCDDKECGPDGCGGMCGECPEGKSCNEWGQCE